MINICYSIYDPKGTYSSVLAASVSSLISAVSDRFHIFLLHDDTLPDVTRNRLSSWIKNSGNEISFIKVELDTELTLLKGIGSFTVGTLFRLKMIDLLPKSVKKILYLDADTIVNVDIVKLWNVPFDGALIIGRKDTIESNSLFKDGTLRKNEYLNAGVILYNVLAIREYCNFYQESLIFFQKHPDCPFTDQDAINFIFRGRKNFIPDIFNRFTLYLRGKKRHLEPCIYHFAGDFVHNSPMESFDRLYWDYLLQSPWKDEVITALNQQGTEDFQCLKISRKVLSRLIHCHQIFLWGKVPGKADQILEFLEPYFSGEQKTAFIDQFSPYGTFEGFEVCSPDRLIEMNPADTFVFILAYNHKQEIAGQLKNFGYREYENYCDFRELLTQEEKVQYGRGKLTWIFQS